MNKQGQRLTAAQRQALENLRKPGGIGGAHGGPVTFIGHAGSYRRVFPIWGPGIATYRALVRAGAATVADVDYGGDAALRFVACCTD